MVMYCLFIIICSAFHGIDHELHSVEIPAVHPRVLALSLFVSLESKFLTIKNELKKGYRICFEKPNVFDLNVDVITEDVEAGPFHLNLQACKTSSIKNT